MCARARVRVLAYVFYSTLSVIRPAQLSFSIPPTSLVRYISKPTVSLAQVHTDRHMSEIDLHSVTVQSGNTLSQLALMFVGNRGVQMVHFPHLHA